MEFSSWWPSALLIAAVVAILVVSVRRTSRSGGGRAAVATYTKDLTAIARAGKLDPICCREEEIERIIHILLRRTKNNPLLLGAPGVGKSAIVEALAQRIVRGEVPSALHGSRVLELRLQDLMAGTKLRGEFEERLRTIIAEFERPGAKTMLFIDEIHLLEATGRSEGALGLTDILKPGLARRDFEIIGATTWQEYDRYIRSNEALDRRLQPVLIDEPNRAQALEMLRALKATYESFHRVTITDAALEAAVRLADEKIDTRYLPDSAIDLIDEAGAKVAIEAERSHHVPLGVVHAAAKDADQRVDADDIAAVVDQWIIHDQRERERDARSAGVTETHS